MYKKHNQGKLRYLEYFPDGFDAHRKYPLMVFLHGAGERSDDLDTVRKIGPLAEIDRGRKLPYVIFAPQCPFGRTWFDYGETLYRLTQKMIDRPFIDATRVYIVGISMGGIGTWEFSLSHPELFAAVLPCCGFGQPWNAARLKDVPVWAFHGARDTDVNPIGSIDMVAAINRAGGHAKLTVYDDRAHDVWTPVFADPAVYDWLSAQQKPTDRT